jgi:O-antigen/teichoic acid export membrane protein
MKQALFQVFTFDLASKITLGVLGLALIRYLPAAEYAAYTFALALAAFTTQSLAATFNRLYILTAAGAGARAEWSSIALQLLLLAILAVLGLPLTASLGWLYGLVVLLAAASCASEFAKTYYQRELRFLRYSVIELSRSLLFFAAASGLIALHGHGLGAAAVLVVQAGSLLLVAAWVLAKEAPRWEPSGRTDIARFARTAARGDYAWLFGYFFVLGIFTQADVFMLKIAGDDDMLATYGSAFRYYSILSLALGSVHAVMLPMVQRSSGRELQSLFDKHRQLAAGFLVIVALCGWLAGWVIPWVDGGKYPGAVTTFRVLCVSAVISFAFSPHVNLVMRFERFRFLLTLILIALAANVGLALLLIPSLGAVGAALATLVSAAVVTVSIFVESRKLLAQPVTT